MTQRPVFIPTSDAGDLVREVFVSFRWNPGFSATQKRKNILALHTAAAEVGLSDLLEVSTKSEDSLGRYLSAFNLEVGVAPERTAPVEVAYQGSKVFEFGGPFTDLFDVAPRDAKRDSRLRESGRLIKFHFGGKDFPLEPQTAFYDWLYLRALVRSPAYIKEMQRYDGFTDIEFNPERSINCQARSCATALSLIGRGKLERVAKKFWDFVELCSTNEARPPAQHDLLR